MPESPAFLRVRLRAAAMATLAAVTLLAVSGCTGAPGATPAPTSSAAANPIFATDEEALAAAEAAYEKYSEASALVAGDGGVNPDRVDAAVSPEYAADLHREFSSLEQAGLRMTGTTRIDMISVAESSNADGEARVTIYLCRDVSGVRVIDATGSDVTPADREERVPSQAFLVSSAEDPATLVVDGVDRWSGDDFC